VGRHAALLWFALTMLGSGTLFVIELVGINLPMAITPTGKLMAHAGLVFGWITMSLIMSWVHISAWKAKQQLSEWQRIRAEELYRALFHDLSSPVGNIELSLSDIKSEDRALQIAAVARVEKSLQTLRGIIGGARLLYALDRGLVMVGSAVANLSEVIAVAANQLRPQVEEKEQQLVILIDALAGVQVTGDSNVLAQHVLMNVLTNAVKYSPRKSTITIDVTMDDKQINVHIRDQGAGMNREQLQSLTQAQGFTVRKETTGELGHGFGLQLARAFLIRYGGTITIALNSGSGTGTCVSLHFPRNNT
jgi:two-component system sensor histidine kinase KdpD